MGLVRRKPAAVKTSEVAHRWQLSPERVRQILKRENVRRVRVTDSANAAYLWNRADVERISARLFGGLMA